MITPLREKEAAAWAGEFAQYVAALKRYFQIGDRRLPPLTFVVFEKANDFDRYRPLGADGKPQAVGAFFLRHGSWSIAGAGGSALPREMRRDIFHEAVHWFLGAAATPNPVWLEEGLAEVFSTFELVNGQAEWGKEIPSHAALLRAQGLMPMEKLLFTGREELFGRDLTHTGIVYAQSWAFAHYLIFGRHDIPPQALFVYAELSAKPIGPDEAFRQAFGKSYGAIGQELARYVAGGAYLVRRMPAADFEVPQMSAAKPIEVEDALARLAFSSRRLEQAETHARAAVVAAADDPRGHEILGLIAMRRNDIKPALQAFAQAAKFGSQDPQIYFEIALAEQNAAAGVGDDEPSMSPESARRVADLYQKAISLHPGYKTAYQNLSGVIGLAEPWGAKDRELLESGSKRWPSDAMITVGLAVLSHRSGDLAAAKAQLDRALSSDSFGDSRARSFARRLAEDWEQQEVIDGMNALIADQKYAQALTLSETWLKRGVSVSLRTQLLGMQASLRETLAYGQIDEALRNKRWSEARRLITEMLAGDTSAVLKDEVRRALSDLDRQGLGLEAAQK